MCSRPRPQTWQGVPRRLEGDLTVVLEVVSQVHRSHVALAQLTLYGVAAFEGGVEAGYGIRHAQKMRCGAVERERTDL